ncbi:hypothetical protein TNIN_359831 [Trichonephila inaurata madagascariensis]|uniref:Uncharacterized protein n=1 Tax=Trichonephila inaurata madagascariensis TaxID=2747483 RepID=A0A8X6Y2D4_9ARAC|nr:hypothetical protein TNIN_359831 [Trichonephila inaurata madagascariensis]
MVFCDASELAYALVIYAVQPQADGNTKVILLVAKWRVAPVKPVAIPRLELNDMEQLHPSTHRVTPSWPFSVSGIDYAGPINILKYRGEIITSSPEHTNDDKLSLRSRCDIVQKMLGFWRKWKIDYLSNLQNRDLKENLLTIILKLEKL